jgi:hypothetical protein
MIYWSLIEKVKDLIEILKKILMLKIEMKNYNEMKSEKIMYEVLL